MLVVPLALVAGVVAVVAHHSDGAGEAQGPGVSASPTASPSESISPSIAPTPEPDADGVPASILDQGATTDSLMAYQHSIVDGASVTPLPTGISTRCRKKHCQWLSSVVKAESGYVVQSARFGTTYCELATDEVRYVPEAGAPILLGTAERSLTISPTGDRVAFTETGYRGHQRLWTLVVTDLTGATVHRLPLERNAAPITLVDGGLWFYSYTDICFFRPKHHPKNQLSYWDFATGEVTAYPASLGRPNEVRGTAAIVLEGDASKTLTYAFVAYDLSDRAEPRELWRQVSDSYVGELDPTGTRFAIVSEDELLVLDAQTGERLAIGRFARLAGAAWNARGDVLNVRQTSGRPRLAVVLSEDSAGSLVLSGARYPAVEDSVLYGRELPTAGL